MQNEAALQSFASTLSRDERCKRKRLVNGFKDAIAKTLSSSPPTPNTTTSDTPPSIITVEQVKELVSQCKKKQARHADQEKRLFDWIMQLHRTGYQCTTWIARRVMYALLQSSFTALDILAQAALKIKQFKASPSWIIKFMKRYDLVLRIPTSHDRKHLAREFRAPDYPPPRCPVENIKDYPLPEQEYGRNPEMSESLNVSDLVHQSALENWNEEKVRKYFEFMEKRVMEHGYPNHRIMNMDETAVEFDMMCRRTIAPRGAKKVVVRDNGGTRKRMTFALSASADGSRSDILAILRQESDHKTAEITRDMQRENVNVPFCFQKRGYMDEHVMLEHYMNRIFSDTTVVRTMLVVDSHCAHKAESVKRLALERGVDLVMIPGGYTPFLQPLDVGIIAPFKHRMRALWAEWILDPDQHSFIPKSGNRRCPEVWRICKWAKQAWESVYRSTVVNSWRKSLRPLGL